MKKMFIVVLVLALLAAGASIAYASDSADEDLAEHHEEMLKIKQEQLDELVADGVITQEEADAFITEMQERFESEICYGTEEGAGFGMFRGYGRGMGRGVGTADGSGYGTGQGYGCDESCILD